VHDLLKETRHRWLNGDSHAYTWLLAELRAGPLADLRVGKSLPADDVLVRTYDALRQALSPLFRSVHESEQRRQQAAPIVSTVLRRAISQEALPEERTLPTFCCALLRTTPVNISRARRRLLSWSRQNLARVLDDIDHAVSRISGLPSDVASEAHARLKRARTSVEAWLGPLNT
jgi:hypothetical protein